MEPKESSIKERRREVLQIIFLLNHIHTGGAGKKPAKNLEKSTARKLLHLPYHKILLLALIAVLPFLLTGHLLLNLPKTLPSLLWHCLLPWKCITPQVHLPAWVAIHHSMSPWSPATTGHRPDELGVGFRPPVKAQVGDPLWDSGILYAPCKAARTHFPDVGLIGFWVKKGRKYLYRIGGRLRLQEKV